MDAREVALLTLNACERQGAWSDGLLKKQLSQAELDARDSALATQLCFGVQQNRMLLDYFLEQFSNIPLKRMESKVVQALRLGLYQMLFLTRIPHSACVNTSVELTRKHCKNPRAAGLVNGVLRSLERNLDQLPVIDQADRAGYLSVLYSHPKWLVEEWMELVGSEQCADLLAANNASPAMCIQVNTCRISTPALIGELSKQGIEVQAHPWLDDCLILRHTGNLEALPAFDQGLFYVQDPASCLAVSAAAPKPGMRVLDACAAPGGKSFAAAIAMRNEGEIISCDLHPHKKKLIAAGAGRLGLSCITPMTADATIAREEWLDGFDLVLADVPCSGLGVIRKKPDIRYKDPMELNGLCSVQQKIIQNVSRYVRPGGVLLYSTCTLRPRENEEIVNNFLARNPGYSLEEFSLVDPVGTISSGMLTLWPHKYETDGFFFARIRRQV